MEKKSGGYIMKKYRFYLLLLVLPMLALTISSGSIQTLSYIELSLPLQVIQWDGGRSELEFADINNDGNKDILSVGDHGNPYVNTQEHGIMVYFGDGTGTNWTLYQNGNFGYGGIAIGDVNNDGKLDVGYGIHHNYSGNDFGDQILEVALGDGSGMNWVPFDDSLASQGETWGMFTSDFGDVDNDGYLDLGSISFGCCAGVHIYKNMIIGKWRQTFGFLGGSSGMEFSFGDINNDGNLDFVVTHQYGTAYFGDGTGNFVLKDNNLPSPGSGGLRGVSLGDVDNDGAKELSFIGTSGSVNVWKWNNAGQNWINLSSNLPTSTSFEKTILYDMNSDGFCDIVCFGNGNLVIYSGNGGTNWTQIASFTTYTPGTYEAMAIADVDNNGFPDIVILENEGSWISSRNYLRFYKETSTATALEITPVFPRGGERFKNHSVRFIEWKSKVPGNISSKVKLEFSSTGNGGPWTTIADSLPNSGRYQWLVPDAITSANCFIRYTIFNANGVATSMNTVPFMIGIVLNAEQRSSEVKSYTLHQNYPNPFNPITNIDFDIPRVSYVYLKIFDVSGREITTLVNNLLDAGSYRVKFDGSNLPSGVYFYSLITKGYSSTNKMILLK
ncbi:MAG: T9SS type A sorting domain-containing protein [Ignavibacteria bacterium]